VLKYSSCWSGKLDAGSRTASTAGRNGNAPLAGSRGLLTPEGHSVNNAGWGDERVLPLLPRAPECRGCWLCRRCVCVCAY
jgi:hypothetical protein